MRNFYLSKDHKTVWNSKEKFNITNSMQEDINLLSSMVTSPTAFRWETPIRCTIPTEYDCIVPGDAYLTTCGAYFPELKFWYYVHGLPPSGT